VHKNRDREESMSLRSLETRCKSSIATTQILSGAMNRVLKWRGAILILLWDAQIGSASTDGAITRPNQ
jgi:hypothetical protein